MNSRYADYETNDSGGDYDNEPNPEIIFTPYSEIEANLASTFGTESQYGQSLGVVFENVQLIDGCVYFDPEKEKHKLFSWQSANDMSPEERYDRGEEPSAEDADEFIRRTYVNNDKEYELLAARVPEVVDDDGETIIEASSRVRRVDIGDGPDDHEYSEFEDFGGDPIDLDDYIAWYDGSSETGTSVSATVLAETLTEYGDLAVEDEDDIHNWLHDTTGQNVLRDDLDGRRVRFFTITRDSENYTYNEPVVEDAETGARIRADNRIEESEGVQEAAEQDSEDRSYPEPIADFIQSGRSLSLTEDRAHKLLNDLIEDDDNSLTTEMVEDAGGADVLVDEVTPAGA